MQTYKGNKQVAGWSSWLNPGDKNNSFKYNSPKQALPLAGMIEKYRQSHTQETLRDIKQKTETRYVPGTMKRLCMYATLRNGL